MHACNKWWKFGGEGITPYINGSVWSSSVMRWIFWLRVVCSGIGYTKDETICLSTKNFLSFFKLIIIKSICDNLLELVVHLNYTTHTSILIRASLHCVYILPSLKMYLILQQPNYSVYKLYRIHNVISDKTFTPLVGCFISTIKMYSLITQALFIENGFQMQ